MRWYSWESVYVQCLIPHITLTYTHYHLYLLLWWNQRNSRPQDLFSCSFSDSLSYTDCLVLWHTFLTAQACSGSNLGSGCFDRCIWTARSLLEGERSRQPQMASVFVTGSIGYAYCRILFCWCGNKEDRNCTLWCPLEPEFRSDGAFVGLASLLWSRFDCHCAISCLL